VRVGQSLGEAEHAVAATVLWHLRVLAGWQPRPGATALRLLAGWFEVANICEHARALAGGPPGPAFDLGALSTAWSRLHNASSLAELRHTLAASPWGDPGGESASDVAVGLGLGWAARVATGVPHAADWACGGAALLVARRLFVEQRPLTPSALIRAERILGTAPAAAHDLRRFSAALPTRARWALAGTTANGELWQAEFRWWATVERDGSEMLRDPRFGPAATIGAAAVLAADAWRCRAALQIAAAGGGPLEVYDAVA
jgi:hypothetical protein